MEQRFKKCANPKCKMGFNKQPRWFWGPNNKKYCSPKCKGQYDQIKYRRKNGKNKEV